LKEVKIIYDDAYSGSQIVTNQVNGIFYHGSDNIIAGKLLDEGFSIKIEGISPLGNIQKEITIPAKTISVAVNDTTSRLTFDQTQTQYLERLWAFLTVKNLLHESEVNKIPSAVNKSKITGKKLPNARPEMSCQEQAENLAKDYNLVTYLTSFIITKDDDPILVNPPSMNDLTESLAKKYIHSFRTNEPHNFTFY